MQQRVLKKYINGAQFVLKFHFRTTVLHKDFVVYQSFINITNQYYQKGKRIYFYMQRISVQCFNLNIDRITQANR